MGLRLPGDLEPLELGLGARHGPDGHAGDAGAGFRERLRGRGGGDDDEVGVGKCIRVEPHRSVQRDEVGVELPNEQAPGILGAREEDTARGTRPLLHETILR